jgi:hypothetical protein
MLKVGAVLPISVVDGPGHQSRCPSEMPGTATRERRRGKEDRAMRILCLNCLRLWPAARVTQRASCPHCGGTLADRSA